MILISGNFLQLVKSFLKNRKQTIVVLNGQASFWANALVGIPQGSIIGPLFS